MNLYGPLHEAIDRLGDASNFISTIYSKIQPVIRLEKKEMKEDGSLITKSKTVFLHAKQVECCKQSRATTSSNDASTIVGSAL